MYRLQGIDRVISRTLACAIVAGVCAGLVLLAARVFGVRAPAAGAAGGGPTVQPGPV